MAKSETKRASESPELTALNDLFGKCRDLESTHNIAAARTIERQVAALVATVAASEPNSDNYAEALQTHEYVLLSVSRCSKRKDVAKKWRDAAYAKGGEAAALKLANAKADDIGAVFSAYNLGIDLIVSENRPQEGLDWMLKAEALLNKLAGKKKLPGNILDFKLFNLRYGMAKAHYDLGERSRARFILKRSLALAPPIKTAKWNQLRSIAKCSELLAQIYLDDMDDKRKKTAA